MEKQKILCSIGISALTALFVSAVFFTVAGGFRNTGSREKSETALNKSAMHGEMDNAAQHSNSAQVPLKPSSENAAPLTPTIKNGIQEFILSASPVLLAYGNEKSIPAWGYNGQIPGPEIRVPEGAAVRIVFTNNLPKPTTIHWHGINVPYQQDGVPGISQKPIQPGETFTYEFVATPSGTHFYHTHGSSHGDEAAQLDMGLSGAFIIESNAYNKPDKQYTLLLDEWQTNEGRNMAMTTDGGHTMNYNLFTINGRAFPSSKPLNVTKGDRVLLRLINAGSSTIHPMHLHGHQFKIVAVDGNPVPAAAQLTRNTVPIHPGETYDIEFIADNPGIWLFHCHELHHAEGGMIVPVVYDGFAL